MRSALVRAHVNGAGENGEWVAGQAAPASLNLHLRQVEGGSIKRNYTTDNPVRAAQLRRLDFALANADLGPVPDSEAPTRLLVRMWAAHTEWAVCTGAWASAYALELAARTRAETQKARDELFKAHRMVGKVAARIRIHRADPTCLLEEPGGRDGLRRGAAPGAALPPPVLPSEERLELLLKVTKPELPREERVQLAQSAAVEQERVSKVTMPTMNTPVIRRALTSENLSILFPMNFPSQRHGAASSAARPGIYASHTPLQSLWLACRAGKLDRAQMLRCKRAALAYKRAARLRRLA